MQGLQPTQMQGGSGSLSFAHPKEYRPGAGPIIAGSCAAAVGVGGSEENPGMAVAAVGLWAAQMLSRDALWGANARGWLAPTALPLRSL